MARYRADLIETAWGVEKVYGTYATTLNQGWGLVTAGITLPDPRYDHQPFYGVGVDDRNLLTYIQGRQTLEGSIGTIMLCHDNSRLILGDSLGQIFNATPVDVNTNNFLIDGRPHTDAGREIALYQAKEQFKI